MKLYKYTPALLDPKTLENTLIGRDIELDNLKRILKSASAGKSFSHAILIGPKGIGKSHLLRILYLAVSGAIKTKGLNVYKNKFIPVIFSEEEYPSNITKFVNLTLTYLSDSGFADIPPIPEELVKPKILNIKEKEVAIDYLRTFKKKTGKILLLLVDNINDIMERFTDEEQSSLREVLMTYDSVLLVGSAPTLFDSIINHKRPFYNFFETIWLKDLSFEDAVFLLKRYAELDDRNDLIEKFEESEAKLKALHELAGGNPRLILCLYHIIAEGDITSVEETFLKLLDELSPYFRERIRDLSEQQKEIIDVMAKAEGLLTPTEIATRCYMPVNTVLSQIKRLEKVGCIKIAKKLTKKVFYDFNERLFSLWRQMRVEAGRKRLGFIAKFLEVWFTKDELFSYLDKTLDKLREGLSDTVETHHNMAKLWYLKEAIPEFKGRNEVCVACTREDYDIALRIIDKALIARPDDTEMLSKQECIYLRLGKYNESIEACKKAIERNPEMYEAWGNLGAAYKELKKYDEAIEAYKNAIEIKPDSYWAWNDLGNVYEELKRFEDAKEAYKKAIEIESDRYEAWGNLGAIYKELNNHNEAIEAYKKVVEIEPDTQEAWHMMGHIYVELKKYIEASKAFEKAIYLRSNESNDCLWYWLGYVYLGIEKYDKAIDAFKKYTDIHIDDTCAWYLMGSAYLYVKNYYNAFEAFKKASIGKDCDHHKHLSLVRLSILYLTLFIEEVNEGVKEPSLLNLKESLSYIPLISCEKEDVFDSYARSLKYIIKTKNINLIKTVLKEIELANQNDLLEFLSPYATLTRYFETKKSEIIDRLRSEERIVVEDMLRMLEDKTNEKPVKRN